MRELKEVRFTNRIQVTLALSIGILMITVISAVALVLYYATDQVIKENARSSSQTLIQQVNYDIEYYLRTIEVTIDGLRYSSEVGNYFEESSQENTVQVIDYIDSLLENREDMISIVLIKPDGSVLTNDRDKKVKDNVDFLKESYYIEAMAGEDMVVSPSHVQNILIGQYQWVVSCSRSFQDAVSGEKLGVILVDLNFSLIEDMVSRISLGDRGYVFITDQFGALIYHPKRELIYNGLREEAFQAIIRSNQEVIPYEVDGDLVEYTIASSKYSNWKVIGKVYVDDLNVHRSTLTYYFLILIFTAFVVSILLVSIIAVRILHPIKNLLKGMSTFQSGQLDTRVQVESNNELGILTSTFNQMTGRIKALVEKMQMVEMNKRKSDLDALQAQINPHFLYNTLDSIVWMSEAGKKDEVVKMTSSLAKLFRISINKGDEFITVAKEIEHVESYLFIQQMRYGEKLTYDIQVEEEIFNQRMIKIVLQPIVENAIYHGIKALPEKGRIRIRGRAEESFLLFEIEDNGIGMDEETKAKLLSGKILSSSKGSGVGVYNVDQRIKLYYGKEYGLKIESELYEGTTVFIRLPMFKGEPNEKH